MLHIFVTVVNCYQAYISKIIKSEIEENSKKKNIVSLYLYFSPKQLPLQKVMNGGNKSHKNSNANKTNKIYLPKGLSLVHEKNSHIISITSEADVRFLFDKSALRLRSGGD